MRAVNRHNQTASEWLVPLIAYLVISGALATAYLLRCMWAYPDVPYLTQLTAINLIEPALNGDFNPLRESFFRFDGEHKLFTYFVYLYINARFFSFSTYTEMVIWTISLYSQTLMLGIYLLRRFRIGLFSFRFLVTLLIPALTFSPIIGTGRGMETQIQVSTTILIAYFLLINRPIRLRIFAPLTITLSAAYVLLFAGAYASGATFALTCALILCFIPGVCERDKLIRLLVSTIATWTWMVLYFVWFQSTSSPAKLEQQSLVATLRDDPIFVPKFFFVGLSSTVTNINMHENLGLNFYKGVYVLGACIAALIIVMAFVVLRSTRARRHALLPLLLILYGIGTIIAVMIGRHPDPYWLLNGWYPFQFRLLADGMIILAVTSLTWHLWHRRIGLTIIFVSLSFVVCSAYVVSVRYQLQRNKYERVYFEEIRTFVAETPPASLRGSEGLTPIYLSPDQTALALRFLRRYHLVPFND
jgi:hypothetical protein